MVYTREYKSLFADEGQRRLNKRNSVTKKNSKNARSYKHMLSVKGFIRFVVVFILSLVVVSSLLMIQLEATDNQAHLLKEGELQIVVQSGDTLWSISRTHANSQKDLRYVTYLIQNRNQLSSADIYPGQKLIIPVIK